eukprot:21082-Prymnesium_polylepis.1
MPLGLASDPECAGACSNSAEKGADLARRKPSPWPQPILFFTNRRERAGGAHAIVCESSLLHWWNYELHNEKVPQSKYPHSAQ